MAGHQLSGMDASDMLDILHLFFEEDYTVSSEEELVSRSNIRTSLYREFYNKQYKYKYEPKKTSSAGPANDSYTPSATQDFDDLTEDESMKPFDPKAEKPKAFVEPTDFNPDSAMPFGNTLEAPLGH